MTGGKRNADGKACLAWLAAIILGCIFAICMMLIISGTVKTSITCFAVDTAGNVYVGGTGQIIVYTDGVEVRRFGSVHARAYAFTIDEENVIWVSSPTQNYTMDMYGRVLKTWTGEDNVHFDLPLSMISEFTAANGDVYELKKCFGRPHIVKNGMNVVYQMPMFSYIIKVLFFSAMFAFASVVIYIVILTLRKKENIFGYHFKV